MMASHRRTKTHPSVAVLMARIRSLRSRFRYRVFSPLWRCTLVRFCVGVTFRFAMTCHPHLNAVFSSVDYTPSLEEPNARKSSQMARLVALRRLLLRQPVVWT